MFCKTCFKVTYRPISTHRLLIQNRSSGIHTAIRFISSIENSFLKGYSSLQYKCRWFSEYCPIIESTKNYKITKNYQECLDKPRTSNSNLLLNCSGMVKLTNNVTRKFSSESKSNQVAEQYYIDNQETRDTIKLYPSPKNILHTVFTLAAQETKDTSLNLSPLYKSVQDQRGSKWICTYNLRWPVEIKFIAKDSRKSTASHKAALAALSWLRRQNKITKDGHPIIYDKDDVKQLITKTIPSINLDRNSIRAMQGIINVYEEKMIPYIMRCNESPAKVVENRPLVDEENELYFGSTKKKLLGLHRYQAVDATPLPITPYKEEFIDLLRENQVVIVKGEPGCGKSTRIPQYVLESWAREAGPLGKPGMVAVTQPRRIAAISLANRVCSERKESIGQIVGYQVRLNSKFSPLTGRILYCTTGILLRHVQSDSALSEYSHIILDEAHERDVNTDLLMNLLKNSMKKNPELKVIIMSATIDTDMFSKYYDDAPVIEIPGFTYPVERFFIDSCKELDLNKTLTMCEGPVPAVIHDDVVEVIKFIHAKKPEGAILCFLPGWEDISKIQKLVPQGNDITVHCLHSRLNDSEQFKIFSRPPPGIRKVILATNIAETSVTIDDVVYVIDTGIHKEQRFSPEKGIKYIDNQWISNANTTQRSGRAGRVQPGECYHLYTQEKYNSFEEYSLPEITRTSLTKIVLDSKAFSNDMDTFEFMRTLPTPPEESAISRAVEELKELELLDEKESLTTLGTTVAKFQLEPKLSKALVNSYVFECVTPVTDIVTLFSTDTELFSSGLLDRRSVKELKSQFCRDSDHLAMMRIFEKYLEVNESGRGVEQFCYNMNLMPHKMGTLRRLRDIHFNYLTDGFHDVLSISDKFSDNDEFVKAVLYSGIGNILQYRNWDIVKNRLKNNTNILLTRNNHKATITPESVNYRRTKFPSNYLLYINETRSNIRRTTLVRECSFLSNLAVLLLSNRDLQISEITDVDISETDATPVKIAVKDTPIQFICDKEQAEKIVKCKQAIQACYNYIIAQITSIGERNEEANASWSEILELLNKMLSTSNKNKK